ncbi:uncharacterized protein LOC143631264 [Bidens hawaiensis]|uniref:uncharacterized protein LOC143631264 n=1 Tax=Bidens hawaiensis TaxID=980011 RepID=UPI00404A9BE8
MCESFNKQLVGARDKPVITCLEYIREYMTKRIINVKKMVSKAAGPLTPNARKTFEEIKTEASQLTVLMVDDHNYQVNGLRSQCVVNVKYKTCTCRKWDLTGMLCKHAMAAINDMAINNMNVGIPEQWVSETYWLHTWKRVYDNQIMPIPSEDYWMPSRCPTTLIPPKHHKQIGRPKKKRTKSWDERKKRVDEDKRTKRVEEVERGFSKGGRMTRKGGTVKCGNCGGFGHTRKTCTGNNGTTTTSAQRG